MLLTLGRSLTATRPIKSPATIPASPPSLKDQLSSCVFDVDATVADSYSGSGTYWNNICETPADGAAQSAYRYKLGADEGTANGPPVFAGTAGSQSTYFAMDGASCFSLETNTAFVDQLHRTGSILPHAGFIAFRYKHTGDVQTLIATNGTSSASIGFRLMVRGSYPDIHHRQRGDGGASNAYSESTLIDGHDYLVGWSCNADATVTRFWTNSTTSVTRARAFNAGSSAAASLLKIGVAGNAASSGALAAGTRVYAVSLFNAFLGDTEAAQIFSAYSTRHGRSYT